MRFNKHSHLAGEHAFLSPSYYHWINYTDDRLSHRYSAAQAALLGSEQHRYAEEAIGLREFQMNESTTLGMFINDCIRYRMEPELVLYYSENCFGTADAISFRYGRLRISDLKTGVTRTSEYQLEVYAAIFCLEYRIDPYDVRAIELRIYQLDECREYLADPDRIAFIMNKIVAFDVQINELRMEEQP